MRNEAHLCTIISKSLLHGYKIPDPSTDFKTTSIRCFDGIGMVPESVFNTTAPTFICWEAKHIKKLSAFSFKRIEPHQDMYLSAFATAVGIRALLFVGFSVNKGDNRVYIFDYKDCGHDLYQHGFSIHKPFLEKLPYNEIHKERFPIEKVIYKDDLLKVYGKSDWESMFA